MTTPVYRPILLARDGHIDAHLPEKVELLHDERVGLGVATAEGRRRRVVHVGVAHGSSERVRTAP